uniref:Uncharacterized protein n=1 Tax=Caenorhabditis japonica TaxID=281687 RepID=A0A8R1IQ93_CAEJA
MNKDMSVIASAMGSKNRRNCSRTCRCAVSLMFYVTFSSFMDPVSGVGVNGKSVENPTVSTSLCDQFL